MYRKLPPISTSACLYQPLQMSPIISTQVTQLWPQFSLLFYNAVTYHHLPNIIENSRYEGNDHRYGFYGARWSGPSEDTEFVLSGKEVHF